MNRINLCLLCTENGADKAGTVSVSEIEYSQELRDLCNTNACGRYGSNYTCPPHVGKLHELIEKVKKFENLIVWQNVYKLEDSFDFDGMMRAQKHHNTITQKIAGKLYEELGRENVLVLTAGGCTICSNCSINFNETCAFPQRAMSSPEAYGINVSSLAKSVGLDYMAGAKTVTYFSCGYH